MTLIPLSGSWTNDGCAFPAVKKWLNIAGQLTLTYAWTELNLSPSLDTALDINLFH